SSSLLSAAAAIASGSRISSTAAYVFQRTCPADVGSGRIQQQRPEQQPPELASRRLLLAALVSTGVGAAPALAFAEDALRPPPGEGGCLGCLGVMDGLLARCTGNLKSLNSCVSSQDDRPEVFEVPWQFPEAVNSGKTPPSEEALVSAKAAELRLAVAQAGGTIVRSGEDGRYFRAEFKVDNPLLGKDTDDVEWYFTPDDLIVQFRAERRSGRADFGENRRRLEEIRTGLGWDPLPVLRNRRRAFFFFESPFDDFGPALYDSLRPGQDPTRILQTDEGPATTVLQDAYTNDPTPYEADVLSRQGERLKGKTPAPNPFANDDLGIENLDGLLDAATRDFLRATCDTKFQICD
ncbi:unnamed protein product, partial [Polarella glacialis]